ncbi:hypothetical protein ACP70R_009329 [Stipagrostis hirtigluma subsp. patula]
MGSTTTATPITTSSATQGGGASVLLLPFPGAQGHTNPMLQFAPAVPDGPFRVVAISDGFDDGGAAASPLLPEYWRRLEAVGAETLAELLRSEAREGRPARVLVYDPHLPWARRVAQAAGVAAAAFLTQPCAVELVYGEVWAGRLALPVTDGGELFARGLLGVELGPDDVPPFVAKPGWCPVFLDASLRQFEGLEDADDVLINSFRDLEPMEADYMESTWRAKTVGPNLPSYYLDDDRLPSNKTYGFDLFSSTVPCMAWLDKQPPCSVVLVSYGTVSDYDEMQLEELGNGQCNAGKPFLWVVRSNEEHKLSGKLRGKCNEHGLIVSWCPQLEVLAHKATEAIANGVPMVAIPNWADQSSTAKYVESMWGMGVVVRKDEKGLVTRHEVERCIKKVMDGEKKNEYKSNTTKWMQKAKAAIKKGGGSDRNIVEFVKKYSSS